MDYDLELLLEEIMMDYSRKAANIPQNREMNAASCRDYLIEQIKVASSALSKLNEIDDGSTAAVLPDTIRDDWYISR